MHPILGIIAVKIGIEKEILTRSRLLFGDETMERLAALRVIVFGVGGVGSWCVESLVRSGVGHVTIVDCDRVSVTNINRQAMATTKTVGRVKVEAMKELLMTINPAVDIDARETVYDERTADTFDLDSYDYIVDAIDSLKDKQLLIERACKSRGRFFSSMGAALKMDPTKIQVAEFWKVRGCPLARALRQRFNKAKTKPAKKFQCVFSEELLPNRGYATDDSPEIFHKVQTNGSIMHITAIFGLTIAGMILDDVYKENNDNKE